MNLYILTVKARDGDSGENGRVTYHFKVKNENVQETDEFMINEETGEIRAKVPLDRETKSSYQASTNFFIWVQVHSEFALVFTCIILEVIKPK